MGRSYPHVRNPDDLNAHGRVQLIAKETIGHLKEGIHEGVSAADVKDMAETFMKQKGVDSFWYHGIGALVLVGEQTTYSLSGKDYRASALKVGKEDLVTVDLSPAIGGFWGDLARSFAIRDGEVVEPRQSRSAEITRGMMFELELHESIIRLIGPETTFEDAYFNINSRLEDMGFQNLDFKKNLGHSIEKNMDERIYIESGNKTKFKDIGLFTFEPHIKIKNGKFGFKHEDIYFFDDGTLKRL